jgi:nucleotide-binding universal stress UspA family protein
MTDSASNAPILCAVDFSSDSHAALLWACRQAELTDAPLIILHVVHDPAASPGFYRQLPEGQLRPMEEIAKEMMDEFLMQVRSENPELKGLASASVQMVSGLPPGRIVEVAESLGVSLIVIGSRGRTGLPHVLLGSVAERVVQMAHAPVTVIKAQVTKDN